MAPAACSSNSRKDRNYGSDAGANYQPPEAGVEAAADTSAGSERPDGSADAVDSSTDRVADAGARD